MLKTEMRNSASYHIDRMSTLEMLNVIQAENENAVQAVKSVVPQIEAAVDEIYLRMKDGGRLFYVGCGTSGRLGILDAAECPPTYGVSNDTVIGIIAGGQGALLNAAEGAEDDWAAGEKDIGKYALTAKDSVVGLSVAGGAAYVLGAIGFAKSCGALTVGISCNKGSKLSRKANIKITPDTGAEVITGSTRMKAGTAQKLILNMISTSVMVKMGYVYENMMINLRPTNQKLRQRMLHIVGEILNCDGQSAERLLEMSNWDIRRAIKSIE